MDFSLPKRDSNSNSNEGDNVDPQDIKPFFSHQTNGMPVYFRDFRGDNSASGGGPGSSDNSCDFSHKDAKYYERRRKNNIAARKSRNARKIREDLMIDRVCHLESENGVLRAQVALLREEYIYLQRLIIQRVQLLGPVYLTHLNQNFNTKISSASETSPQNLQMNNNPNPIFPQ